MSTTIREYQPFTHASQVMALWERTLGTVYPITPRVFACRAGGHPGCEPGDALVALSRGRVIGFALADIGRTATGGRQTGHISAVLVAVECQRQGVGSQLLAGLEARLRACGCTKAMTGGGARRFWTGVPDDLPTAKAFFARHGYTGTGHSVPDMVIALDRPYALSPEYGAALQAAGAQVIPTTIETAGQVLAFEAAEFAGWCPGMLEMMAAGDVSNVLAVWHGPEVIGTIQCFTPRSRYRGPNLVWERVHGARMGGYGAVGIAKSWRGKGLGAAMSQAAAAHVQGCGGTTCFIDWVGPAAFYAKLGAHVWRTHVHLSKAL